jgi:hypothetical protein
MYPNDRLVPTVKLNYSATQGFQAAKRQELFIKGPIPMSWLSPAAKLPGKAVHVALALFWLAGMKPQGKVKMTRQAQNLFNVSNDAYRDALPRLEEEGLIKVWRAPGQRAQVEIVRHIAPATEPGL